MASSFSPSRCFLSLVLLVLAGSLAPRIQAQVTTIPAFPQVDDSVTVIFDATQGNGALGTFTGTVYAHTGLITNLSTSPTDWRYVQGVWGTADPEVQMTSLGNHQYKLRYHIRNYYGLPQSETALKMAFVFRNATGSIVGRASDGSDIYVDLYQPGINVSIVQPQDYGKLLEPGAAASVVSVSSSADSMEVYVNNVLKQSTANDTLSYTWTPAGTGKYRVKVRAWTGSSVAWDSAYFFVRPTQTVEALPAGIQDGLTYDSPSSAILSLYAPSKNYVFAVGDYSNWEMDVSNYMKKTPAGDRFWIRLTGLNPGTEYAYQYHIDNNLRVADPYSQKILDPWNDSYIPESTYPDLMNYPAGKTTGIVGVLQTSQTPYAWQNNGFVPPDPEKMVVYELLIRDFTTAKSYQSLLDTLNYLKNLGVNAIELMPVNEFEGNLSWGYNTDFQFAVDKFYGSSSKLKEFIDRCHQEGIAVIMDIVLNHAFGLCPLAQMYWDATNNRPASNNPWFNTVAKHDFNVGNDFNHESAATRYFVSRILRYWLSEFRMDGFRFDLSKGFTQTNTLGNTSAWGALDASRVAILKAYADTVWSVHPGATLILEHFADNAEETILANYGMYLWGNGNYNYNEATMGWVSNSDLSWQVYSNRGWAAPRLVGYMESHDEERLMAKNLAYGNSSNTAHDVKNLAVGLSRIELAANFFIPLPGPKMIWQFGELGYDYPINYPGTIGGTDHRLDEKPIRWDYYAEEGRNRVYNVFKWLNWLKQTEPVFSEGTFQYSLGGGVKQIHMAHASNNVCILGNFTVQTANTTAAFGLDGKWYEFFSGDSIEVQGSPSLSLQPGEYRLYMTKKFPKPVLFTPPPVSIKPPIPAGSLRVYPNPSSDGFRFRLPAGTTGLIRLEVLDPSGRQVLRQELLPDAGGEISLQTHLQPGLYMFRLWSGEDVFTGKLIRN